MVYILDVKNDNPAGSMIYMLKDKGYTEIIRCRLTTHTICTRLLVHEPVGSDA